jgi:adenylate cyclase
VHDKLDLTFEDLGEVEVKNIAEPIRAYRVILDEKAERVITPIEMRPPAGVAYPKILGAVVTAVVALLAVAWWQPWSERDVEPASIEQMAFPLPEEPSIAVLPFENFSADENQEHFADGITEDIIATISKIPGLFVVARNSTFTYKDRPVKVQKVAEDLGVQYVLEGSVRKTENRVRVTAQLIDALRGNHLWAERFDGKVTDIFEFQDQIVIRVADALHAKLSGMQGDKARGRDRTTDNFKAWELHTRAQYTLRTLTKENARGARNLWRRALEIDSGYANAWGGLAWTQLAELRNGWSDDPKGAYSAARKYADKALSLDPNLPRPHIILAFLSLYAKHHDEAIEEAKLAIAIDPNHAGAIYALADIYRYAGHFEEAIGLIGRAIRLNPHYPEWYLYALGMSHFHLGQHTESIEAFEELLKRNPSYNWAHAGLVYNYVALGRLDAAKAEAQKEIDVNPDISLGWIRKVVPYKHEPHLLQLVQALKTAGIPE